MVVLASAAASTSLAAELTYERDVRPILKTHCFHCHGEGGERRGGLDLRLRRLIAEGGQSGEVIVPGAAEGSLLLQRLRDGDMPPEDAAVRPSEAEIETIAAWIAGGAVASRPEPPGLDPDTYITEAAKSHWAYQPVDRPDAPEVTSRRARTPIDRFVLAELEANDLSFSPDADRRALIRRVYFDLLGLPPSPAEVETFLADDSPGAYARLLDRVLSSPHYGERWGRHWLDAAGYADSEGYTADDPLRPYAYKYRDYVLGAFNEDKPFDRFIVEQLAGDELLTPPLENLTPEQAEKLIATGFLRMAPDGTGASGVDQDVSRNDVVAKTVQIVSTSLLGLTVGCAQCHNHRYDPISHVDYHAFRAIFEPALDWKRWLPPAKRRISLYTDEDRSKAAEIEAAAKEVFEKRSQKQEEFIEATFQKELAKLDEALHEPITEARRTPKEERTDEQKELLAAHPSVNVTAGSLYLYDRQAANELKKLADEAEAIRATKPEEEFVRAVWEPAEQTPPETFLFHRGDHEQPKQAVPPRELRILTSATTSASPTAPASAAEVALPIDDPDSPTSGRRLAYARWLTSGRHPLVARVIVNRVWLSHFGRGLVSTPADFGALGVEPTHPALLDWLASEFVASGWSLKRLHRLIMTSTTYRQGSRQHPAGNSADPENKLYWRMPIRRLDAESLRDAVLAASGRLNRKAGGPAVPVMADTVGQFVIGKENLNAGRPGEVLPMHGEEFRRSVYVQARRSRPLSVMEPFDLPRMEPNCTARNTSTVSPQSLLMMNSGFILTRSQDFARRLRRLAGDDVAAQVRLAWKIAFAAAPSDEDVAQATAFINDQTEYFAAHRPPDSDAEDQLAPEDEALASFCHALLSSNRFLYID